jgi:putative transposase
VARRWQLPRARADNLGMARSNRQILPHSPHHLITRGNNRRRLFSYPRDYRIFIWHVGRSARTFDCKLHAILLMANHVHILVTPPSVEAASEFMKKFSQRYAQIRNDLRGGSGKLFEQRFRSWPILSERQLALTTMYIESDPVRSGIEADALSYRWSSYRLHAGAPQSSEIPEDIWTPSSWYVGLGRTEEERCRRYRECFQEYLRSRAAPEHADEVEAIAKLSAGPYKRRLRRPNDSRASEARPHPWPFPRRS